MASRDPGKKPSFGSRIRGAIGKVTHAANEIAFGEIDERTGKRVADLNQAEYRAYADRGRQALPQQSAIARATGESYQPARSVTANAPTGGAPSDAATKARAAQLLNPGEDIWLQNAREADVAVSRGNQLGTMPLAVDAPQLPDLLPANSFDAPAIDESSFDFTPPAATPETRTQELGAIAKAAQGGTAQASMDANETEDEFAIRQAAEAEVAAREAATSPRGVPTSIVDDVGQGVVGAMDLIQRGAQKVGDVVGNRGPISGAVGVISDSVSGTSANIGKRIGGAMGADTSSLEGGEGLLPDIGGDIVMGAGVTGLAKGVAGKALGRVGNRFARGLLTSADEIGEVSAADAAFGRGATRSLGNAGEELGIRSVASPTDPNDTLNPFEAAAFAGAATVPFGAALSGAARAGGAVLGAAGAAAGAVGREVGRTAGALGRTAEALRGVPVDEPTRRNYKDALKFVAGFDNDLIESLSDSELEAAVLATAPSRATRASQASPEVRKLSGGYASSPRSAERGLRPSSLRDETYYPVPEDEGKRIADLYDEMPSAPDDPKVQASYRAFKNETLDQYKEAVRAGYKFEPWTGEGQPYKDSAEMRRDVVENKHIWFFPTEKGFGEDATLPIGDAEAHPLLEYTGVKLGGQDMTYNDLFRGIHDLYGHTKEGMDFGPRGEHNAWVQHSRMYSDAARPAMSMETRGQNSWVNFNKQLRRPDGTIPKKGDPDYIPQEERPFAAQKVNILPEEFSTPRSLKPLTARERLAELSAGDKARVGAVAAGGAAMAMGGEEGEVQKEVKPTRPDPNKLLALAGSLAMAKKPRLAKKMVQSIVGRSADEALRLMRQAGLTEHAENFQKFIAPSRVRTPVFHGTFNSFDTHRGSENNLDGWYGSRDVAYFSSGPTDASNYADTNGPDSQHKIQARIDELMDRYQANPTLAPKELRGKRFAEQYTAVEKMVEEEFQGGKSGVGPNVQPAWLRMEKPVEVLPPLDASGKQTKWGGEPQGTVFRTDEGGGVVARYAGQTGEEFPVRLREALETVSVRYGVAADNLFDDLASYGMLSEGDEFSAFDFDKVLRGFAQINGISDPATGQNASGQFIADVYREAGFDGITMHPATQWEGEAFVRGPDDLHHIAFSPGQIKSVTGNSGTFDWGNPNITLGVAGLAMLGANRDEVKDHGSDAGLPALALGGMVSKGKMRFPSVTKLRGMSAEYAPIVKELGFDPAQVGAGVINQGLVRSFADFQSQMRASLGDKVEVLGDRMPVIFSEAINLAFAQQYPILPRAVGDKVVKTPDVALKLLEIGRGVDKLTDVWSGGEATVAGRMQRVAKQGFKEANKALVLIGDAARWYRQDVEESIKSLQTHYATPGVLTPEELALYGENPFAQRSHQTLYKAILAVTSNGNKVLKNAETADKIYRNFLRTGKLSLFEDGKRTKLKVGKYALGAADLLNEYDGTTDAAKAVEWLRQKPLGEVTDPLTGVSHSFRDSGGNPKYKNHLEEQLELLRIRNGWTSKELDAQRGSAGDAAALADDAPTVGDDETGIWTGPLHTPGIGHARSHLHEDQLIRLQTVMERVGGLQDGKATSEGIEGLERWLTTRYLGGKEGVVKKAYDILGDPPSIHAPKEEAEAYVAKLAAYRAANNINPDDLLVQYHSINGPETRKRLAKPILNRAETALNQGELAPLVDENGLSDKIGRFFLNLYGIHDEATVDLWATRWYRRINGFADVRGGKLYDGPMSWEKGEIREAFTQLAQQMSTTTGKSWSASEVQALLWYWEKELYRLAGAKDSDKVSFSLASEAVAANSRMARGLESEATPREWVTQQLANLQNEKNVGVTSMKALQAQARANPDNGAVPTLSYDHLKGKNGISFAAAPVGLAMMEDRDEDMHNINAIEGAGMLAAGAGLLYAGRKGLLKGIKLPVAADEPMDMQTRGYLELFLKDSPKLADGKRAEGFLSSAQRGYTRLIDEIYPLKVVGEIGADETLVQQARASTGWLRAGTMRIKQELGPIIRGAEQHRGKTIVLASAQREMELRRNGYDPRTSHTDEQLQDIIDANLAIPEVAASAEELRLFYRNLIDRKLEEGVIDRDNYDRIIAKGQFYVPMVRDFGYETVSTASSKGGRFNNLRSGIRGMSKKNRHDPETGFVDPFEQAYADALQTERTIAKQRVTNKVAVIAEQYPEAMASLIREVVNPLKDITDIGVGKAARVLATAQDKLATIQTKATQLESAIAKLENKGIKTPHQRMRHQQAKEKLVNLRFREATQTERVTKLEQEYLSRESQKRSAEAKADLPATKDMMRVQAIVGGKLKTYEVLDEDLFNAWAAMPPQSHGGFMKFLSGSKRLLQATVTALPDFGAANGIRDGFMTSTQYPLSVKRALAGAAIGAGVGAYRADNDKIDAASGAGFGLSAGALAKHTARFFYAFRDVLSAQGNVGRSGAAFGAVVGAGVGAGSAEEGDRLQAAAVGAGAGAGIGSLGLKALAKYGDPTFYERWVKEGGAGFGFYPRERTDVQQMLNELRLNGTDPRSILHPKSLWDGIQLINQAVEEAPRLARYRDALERGETQLGAVSESRDISLDFAKSGSKMKGINSASAFYNAKLQGTDKLIRLLSQPKTWGIGMATITAPSVALWNINKDNQEYRDRPTWEKNLFWHIPKGEGKGFFLLPKPFEVGFIFASLPERILDYIATNEDPEVLEHAMTNMLGSTLSGFVPWPTAIKPAVEAAFNYDQFRGGPVVPMSLANKLVQEQFDNRTSNAARAVGKLTDMAGVLPGVPDDGASPEKIDHLISGYTGGIGRLANQGIDSGLRYIGKDDRPAPVGGTAPITGRFNSRPDVVTESESAFRRRFSKADRTYRGLRNRLNEDVSYAQFINAINSGNAERVAAMVKDRDVRGTLQYLAENGEQINEYNRLKQAKKELDEATRARRAVENLSGKSAAEKRELVTAINKHVGLVARRAIED